MQDYVKQHLPTLGMVAALLLAMQGLFIAPAERRTQERFDLMEARLDRMEAQSAARFDTLNERLRNIDQRFDLLERTIDERFREVDERFDNLQ